MPKVLLNTDRAVSNRRDVLYERYGGFMTTANIMSELGVSRVTAMKFTADLPSYSPTGKKVYDIMDVARKIEAGRTPPEVSA